MFEAKSKKEYDKEQLYMIRQLVYKVLANSIYGAVSSNFFRAACQDLGASITTGGKHLLFNTAYNSNEYIKGILGK